MRLIGKLFLSLYRGAVRLQSKWFSILISGAFASYGSKTVLMCPLRLSGESRIAIGDRVFIGANSWLQTLPDDGSQSVAMIIGSGTSMAGGCVISAARKIVLEPDVLLARNVYISDHMHRYDDSKIAILAQGIDKIRPVTIGQGAWIGQNVVICPGVTIGKGAVVGANSVVNQDVPAFSIAAGAPARVVKTIARQES